MIRSHRSFRIAALALLLVLGVGLACGCGQIADKDNIRIAKFRDSYLTRGDLYKLIHEMQDTDRPKIRNKGDFLRVLNQYIDAKIKIPLGRQLAEEGKISVPRVRAREMFFQECGDDAEQFRAIWDMEVPPEGQVTPLMQTYNLTPSRLKTIKTVIESGTDDMEKKLLGDEAVAYLALLDFKDGKLVVEREELEREYRLRKDSLRKLEWMSFMAISFPAGVEGALEEAAAVRKRINTPEDFDAVIREYAGQGSSLVVRPIVAAARVIESEIENNPNLARFKGFWSAASGAKVGDIIGPVYLPEYQQIAQDAQGRSRTVQRPDAYLVLRVLGYRPETTMTIEECQAQLAPPILVARKMRQLREENGVEIYDDKLPDPTRHRADFDAKKFSF